MLIDDIPMQVNSSSSKHKKFFTILNQNFIKVAYFSRKTWQQDSDSDSCCFLELLSYEMPTAFFIN